MFQRFRVGFDVEVSLLLISQVENQSLHTVEILYNGYQYISCIFYSLKFMGQARGLSLTSPLTTLLLENTAGFDNIN